MTPDFWISFMTGAGVAFIIAAFVVWLDRYVKEK